MKISNFSTTMPDRIATEGWWGGGTASGSNSASGDISAAGDVIGSPGDYIVVGLRDQVSLGSNIGGNAIGDVLTIIQTSPRLAVFSAPSNTGSGSTTPFDHGNMGSTETVDLDDGDWHRGTLDAACTISIAGFTIDLADVLVFKVTQDGTGGWGITWDPDVVSLGGTQPDLAAGAVSWFVLWSDEGDATVYLRKVPATSGGSGLPWFVVTDYGATGNGSTNDTAAINLAIAALNTATRGVLYFPAGTYLCSSALTAITASCTIFGDGMTGDYAGSTTTPTKIICSSGTATFMTIGAGVHVRDLSLVNTAGSVTAGYGIGGTDMNMSKFEDVSVIGFWINFDIDGGLWAMTRCYSRQPHKYGIDISYVASPDGGDWSISDSYIVDGANSSDAAIHVTSGGGMRIVNNKINSSTSAGFGTGIDISVTTGVNSGVIQISNTSIENIRAGDAIRIVTTGTATMALITISGIEVALNSNNAGRAVLLNASSAGAISGVAIGGSSVFATSGTPRAAIQLLDTDKVDLGHFQLVGFNSRYTSTGDTNTTDGGTGGGSVATDAIWDAAGDLAVGTGADTAAKLAKGSAGAVLAMGNSAVIWNAGTSFPASKATNDVYRRTDLQADFYWDGTRWVSVELFRESFGVGNVLPPVTIATAIARMTQWGTDFDLWLEHWSISTYVATTNNGTNFWTVSINRFIANDTATALDSFTTSGDTVNNWTRRRRALGVVYSNSTNYGLSVLTGLTLSPGGMYFTNIALEYRLIAT